MGFVLVGGRSSRMGVDKAFVDLGGQTLLDRALNVLGTVCDQVAIVGDPAKFDPAKLHPVLFDSARAAPSASSKCAAVVADIFPGCGPLAGIHAALLHSSADLNLILAVDMPFISRELLAFLLTAAEDPGVIVTVPRAGKGLQPLCAVYRREFSAVAEHALQAGKYKIDAAFAGTRIRVIEPGELADAGFSERSFFNVNTPQDRLAAEGGSSYTFA